MSTERLQKILAKAGVASRRAAERLITEGRVRVNGRIVRELGTHANAARDRVEVDGRRLVAERPVYFLMHKPRGVVTTLDDPEGRKSVKDLLRDVSERVFPVGRLDFHTSGVLLLTNDGALAQALLHPTRAVPKTYSAKLQGHVDERGLEMLRGGVVLDDGEKTAPADVHLLRSEEKHTSLEITIAEGKNRQIHRMAEAIGRPVLRLIRIAFAGLTIEGLRAGQLRPLSAIELGDLKQKYLYAKRRPQSALDFDEADAPELEAAFPAPAARSAPTRVARVRDRERAPDVTSRGREPKPSPRENPSRSRRGGRADASDTFSRGDARGQTEVGGRFTRDDRRGRKSQVEAESGVTRSDRRGRRSQAEAGGSFTRGATRGGKSQVEAGGSFARGGTRGGKSQVEAGGSFTRGGARGGKSQVEAGGRFTRGGTRGGKSQVEAGGRFTRGGARGGKSQVEAGGRFTRGGTRGGKSQVEAGGSFTRGGTRGGKSQVEAGGSFTRGDTRGRKEKTDAAESFTRTGARKRDSGASATRTKSRGARRR